MSNPQSIVCQSFRRVEVPPWIERCLQTTRAWAQIKGHDYFFVDDQLFDYVPAWFRDKVQGQIQLMSDLARLLLAREMLAKGYERVVWVDADVVIFNPGQFDLPLTAAFCQEVWVTRLAGLFTVYRRKVNNAVAVFTQNGGFLEDYIEACQSIVRQSRAPLAPAEVGTLYLARRYRQTPFPLIRSVGLFSPILLQAVVSGNERMLARYVRHMGSPIYAANLTLSYRNRPFRGVTANDDMFDQAIGLLLQTQGEILNRYVPDSTSVRA